MMNQLLDELNRFKNDEIAEHSQRFFKTAKGQYGEGDIFLGIRVPTLRKLSKKYTDLPLEQTIILLKNKFHEARLLALFILTINFEKTKSKELKKEIYELYLSHTAYINNWDLVDSSAHKIVGAYLLDKDREILYDLARSDLLWDRRIAIVATFWFIKHMQFQDTIGLSNLLLKDKEDLIHKAVGWALREVGKNDKKILVDFLEKHHKIMPRVMLRYSLEKCTDKEKKRYMDRS